jgi:hypothetical protein
MAESLPEPHQHNTRYWQKFALICDPNYGPLLPGSYCVYLIYIGRKAIDNHEDRKEAGVRKRPMAK